MGDENTKNQADVTPDILITSPAKSDVLCETFAQKEPNASEIRNNSSEENK